MKSFIKAGSLITALIILPFFLIAQANAQGKVRIIVSVDWEGDDLQPENLQAMQKFRNDFPVIPLQHFLNAAYYLKPNADSVQITKLIKSVLLPKDEHGLHIHAWRSLVESSGVKFRTDKSFVYDGYSIADCVPDCGHDVALTSYSIEESRKIIAHSIEILQREGFHQPKSFRAGGWQADEKVLQALAEEGFTLDSSATYAEFLRPQWEKYNLYELVAKTWSKIKPTSQPYVYKTSSGLKILELPNNSCLSDYMTGADMLKVFQANAGLLRKHPQKDVYLSIGFHQETAFQYLPRLRKAIKLIQRNARQKHIPIEFTVSPIK